MFWAIVWDLLGRSMFFFFLKPARQPPLLFVAGAQKQHPLESHDSQLHNVEKIAPNAHPPNHLSS